MRSSTLLVALGSLASLASATPTFWPWPFGGGKTSTTNDPTATIKIGQIVGTQTSLPSATQAVNKFLGVPFAVSPPGRFAEPVAAKNLNAPLKTQQWSAACYQAFTYPLLTFNFVSSVYNEPPAAESEDCLYLNVYAPAGSSSTPRSVFFWIPAGEMAFGNAGQPSMDGSAFAAYNDVIVVTANFRTNVFGLPSSPQLPGTSGNLALLDQRLALQWIQDNIAAFGGDPKKVTVGGVSSGSWNAEIFQYTYPQSNPPFRAVIMASGQSVYQPFPITTNSDGWNTLVASTGCFLDPVDCLKLYPGIGLKTYVDNLGLTFYLNADGATLPTSPYNHIATGNFTHVPILAGSTSQEGRFYAYGQTNETQLVQQYFGSNQTLAKLILQAYPVDGVKYKNDYEAISGILTDLIFGCTTSLYTTAISKQNVPVWQYLYDAAFPNIAFNDDSGVYHASDVRLIFQSYPGGPMYPVTATPSGSIRTNLQPTQQEKDLSKYINAAWAKFIKDPSSGPGWDQVFASGSPKVAALGSNGSSGAKMVDRAPLTEHCNLFFGNYAGQLGVPPLGASALTK